MPGSAKAGTTAERHKCELRILASTVVRAPPKRASGELCFPLTKTYMDVGKPETEPKTFPFVTKENDSPAGSAFSVSGK
jgi:hypothetical protein